MKIINIIKSKKFYFFMLLLLSTQGKLRAQYYAEDHLKLRDKAIFISYINTGEREDKSLLNHEGNNEQKGNILEDPNAKNYKIGTYKTSSVMFTKKSASLSVKGTNAKARKARRGAKQLPKRRGISSNLERGQLMNGT